MTLHNRIHAFGQKGNVFWVKISAWQTEKKAAGALAVQGANYWKESPRRN